MSFGDNSPIPFLPATLLSIKVRIDLAPERESRKIFPSPLFTHPAQQKAPLCASRSLVKIHRTICNFSLYESIFQGNGPHLKKKSGCVTDYLFSEKRYLLKESFSFTAVRDGY
ncbi:hypothetical protein CDAR_26301 [Caerostris darwini]|uniref:Uncharacterized protein n=1 Tax=Caerostris darwini TaxID=1538125 RepID=A0AAV4NCB5_9ARAC|nr:hypothetical protein CDAR_26301 [Caerostris darwini]